MPPAPAASIDPPWPAAPGGRRAGTRLALRDRPRTLLGGLLLVAAVAAQGSLGSPAAAPGRSSAAAAAVTDLTGEWILNGPASQLLAPPQAPGRGGPANPAADGPMSPEDSVLPDPPARRDENRDRPPPRRRAPSWLIRPERLEALRMLLGETRSLSIVQTPTYVDLRTELNSRSLEIGAESQVSLPTGELADQKVRWQGGRLVVERRVPRGVKIVETFQRLAATDQLEVTVRRSGGPDDGLGKVELRRLFDRELDDTVAPAASDVLPGGASRGPRAATSEIAR